MSRFSANLGLLWSDLPLPAAIRAAGAAGFDAVEAHWPYQENAQDVSAALMETGLPMLSVNTPRGIANRGEFGVGALPEHGEESVLQALELAERIDAQAIHVLPGIAAGPAAWTTFEKTLRLACRVSGARMILIEPINQFDVPGYLLHSLTDALAVIEKINHPNLKLMFDFYHVGRIYDDPLAEFQRAFDHIGHIQFASVPDRGPPDIGDLDYHAVFEAIDASGWTKPLGAEYRPSAETEASLGWMSEYKG